MFQNVVELVLLLVLLYMISGLVFAVWFAFNRVNDFDEQARSAPRMFRLLIIPASSLLWIYLLIKLRGKRKE